MNVKKTVIFLLLCTCILTCAAIPVSAREDGYSWYCAHVKGHVQPAIGADVAFVEENGAYYIDRRNTDPDAAEKVIYLTFDVGYENGNVSRILDALRDGEVPAAFFVLGHVIEKNTELVQRMIREGHTVCNHTVRHKDMSKLDDDAFLAELRELERMYEERIGAPLSPYYRPPEGRFSKENLLCAEKNGYKTVFWSFAYPDWDNGKQMSSERAKRIILDNAHNGEVMLLHPTSQTNAEILGDVIRELKAAGYRFGTLDELTQEVE